MRLTEGWLTVSPIKIVLIAFAYASQSRGFGMTGLERRVRRLEWTNRALVGLLGLVVVMGAVRNGDAEFNTVKARNFEVVDEKGAVQAFLGTSGKSTMFGMGHNKDNEIDPVIISVSEGIPRMVLSRGGTLADIEMMVTNDSRPFIALHGRDGHLVGEIPKGGSKIPLK